MWGAVGSFLKPLAGTLISGAMNLFGGERSNASNAAQAQRQMDFQERMSSTSIQRQVADYRAAGLNPALAYGQGGASSPTGSSAQMTNTLAGAVGGAREASLARAQMELIRAQVHKTAAEEQNIKNEGAARIALLGGQTEEVIERARRGRRENEPEWIDMFRQQLNASIRASLSGAAQAASQADINQLHPRVLIKDGLELLRDQSRKAFGSSAWEKYMQSTRKPR